MENWKDIEGFDGLYQISSLGNAKSLDRLVNGKNSKRRLCKGKFLKLLLRKGYLAINLYNGHIKRTINIHRLVAMSFIPNPENKQTVNHKDGNKLNNNVENLEWVTISENRLHSYRILQIKNPMFGRHGKLNPNSKPVICINDNNKRFDNIKEAASYYNVFDTTIVQVCKGKKNHVGGLKFKYA